MLALNELTFELRPLSSDLDTVTVWEPTLPLTFVDRPIFGSDLPLALALAIEELALVSVTTDSELFALSTR